MFGDLSSSFSVEIHENEETVTQCTLRQAEILILVICTLDYAIALWFSSK